VWCGVRREELPHLDRRYKAIALSMQRAQEARRPPALPQRLAQRLHTGGERLVADKLVGPQVLEEFLLGHHPLALRQEVGEHLKDFTPELYRLSSAMQFLALGIKDIVAKDIAHHPTLPAASEPIVLQDTHVGGRSPRLQHPISWSYDGVHHSTQYAKKYPKNIPKLP
jgi:hypothetical protein